MGPKRDNYAQQAEFARKLFLAHNQSAIITGTGVQYNENWLHLALLNRPYRICRADGHIFRHWRGGWRSADSHWEVLTIFDYLCDAKPGRRAAGEYVSMASLGNHVHTGLSIHSSELEHSIDRCPDAFCRACLSLGGAEVPGGDRSFVLPLFPDLPISVRFWHSDAEFPPKLDLLWDKNALQFLRYETTWYASGILRRLLSEAMDA